MSSTLPPSTGPQGTPNSGAGSTSGKGDSVTVALALILVGVMVLLLLVAFNDDNDQTVTASGTDSGDSTSSGSSGSGDSSGSGGSGGSGGELPPGEYQYTLTAPAGTVQYSGSCNVVDGVLAASGVGAQQETIVLNVDVASQIGGATVAALGSEFEGTIDMAVVGEGTFQVAGLGSEADDSAGGAVQFTVAGGCNTGTTGSTTTSEPTAPPETGIHDFTATIPEGTAAMQGNCVVVDGLLTVEGSGAAGEILSISADANNQSGSMAVAAAGASYEGVVTVVVIGEGSFEVSANATPADDSATGEVQISASGGCDT